MAPFIPFTITTSEEILWNGYFSYIETFFDEKTKKFKSYFSDHQNLLRGISPSQYKQKYSASPKSLSNLKCRNSLGIQNYKQSSYGG